jgi:hypothetical protein
MIPKTAERGYTTCLRNKYINFNCYPMKIIERFDTNFVTRLWGLLASPLPINEEQKTNARKLSLISCELKYSG